MHWGCDAPLWAWCCCVPGMNCGKRWKETRRWRREELHERNAGRENEASGRNDVAAVRRAATGSHARAGSVRAHAGMRHVPHAVAGAGARIAVVDARDAGGRRAAAFAAGAIPGEGAEIDAMDLGPGVWAGGNRRLRTLYGIYPTLAAATGASRIRRLEPAGAADFPGDNVERMAIGDDTSRGAGNAYPGGTGRDGFPAANPAGIGVGAGVRGVLHGAGDAIGSFGDGVSARKASHD